MRAEILGLALHAIRRFFVVGTLRTGLALGFVALDGNDGRLVQPHHGRWFQRLRGHGRPRWLSSSRQTKAFIDFYQLYWLVTRLTISHLGKSGFLASSSYLSQRS